MPSGNLPPNVHRVGPMTLATGERVYYFSLRDVRKSRFWRDTKAIPTDAGFFTAYGCAIEEHKPGPKGMTTEALVDAYLSSPHFRGLKPRTQADYRRWALRVAEEFKHDPAKMFEEPEARAEVNKWRQAWAHSAKQYDYAGTFVTLLLNWALEEGLIVEHHCTFKKQYQSDRSDVVWRVGDIETFVSQAPPWVSRILIAATETGMRPGDLIRLSRAHVESTPGGRRIRIKTNKRGQSAFVPVTQAMANVIDDTPDDRLLILVNAHGNALTEHRASEAIRQWRNKSGLTPEVLGYDLRLYDARGTAATRLLRSGLSLGQIAGVMGWSLRTAAAMIERYAQVSPSETDEIHTLLKAGNGGEK